MKSAENFQTEKFLFSLFNDGITPYKIEEKLYSVFPQSERKSEYDFKARFYDYVIGNAIYNRFVWGNSLENYRKFCADALRSEKNGAVLDAGCGSLVFTARAYAEYEERPVVLLDRSLAMLKKGMKRLRKIKGEIPQNVVFLQADVFSLPFREESFTTVNSHGMLHLFEDTKKFLDSLNRVTARNGKMFFLVLLAEDLRGKFFTRAAKRTGEIALALNSSEMRKRIEKLGYNLQFRTAGNIGYVVIGKKY